MRIVLAAVLSIVIPISVLAGDNGYKVTYDGGSLADVKSGTGLKLYIEGNQARLVKDSAVVATIPASVHHRSKLRTRRSPQSRHRRSCRRVHSRPGRSNCPK